MAPTKRVATNSPTCSRKIQRTAELTPFDESCEAFLGLVDEHEHISESVALMLKVAARFALQPPQAARHHSQACTVRMLSDVFHEVARAKKRVVEVLQQRLGDLAEVQNVLQQDLDVANKKMDAIVQARIAAEQGMAVAGASVTAARKAAVAAKHLLEELQSKHEECKRRKRERLFITDNLAKLKEGNFSGKEWRQRNKQIEVLVSVLEQCNCEKSLLTGLPVALKEKPSSRGHFATKVVEYVEMALNSSVVAFEDKLNNHDAEVRHQEKVIAEAEEAVAKAEVERDTAETAFITTDNILLAATGGIATDTDKLTAVKLDVEAMQSDFSSAKGELERVSALLVRFATIEESGAIGAEPPSPPKDAVDTTEGPANIVDAERELVVECARRGVP